MNRLIKLWDQFLFGQVSPLPLALFRLVIGWFVFVDLLALFPSRLIWWSDHGVLSDAAALAYYQHPRFSLLQFFPQTDASFTAFYIFLMVSALALASGLFTRLSAAIVFLGLTSLAHRDPLLLNSGDSFLRLSAFWLIWVNSSAVWSLNRKFRAKFKTEAPPTIEAWNLRLPQIQLSVVYFTTVLFKLSGEAWTSGYAVGYVMKLEEFRRFPVPKFMFSPFMNHVETWGALAIEAALGTLIWVPKLRIWVVLAGVALHLGIEYSMNIPLFEWIMIGSLVLFVSEKNWQDLFRRFPIGSGKKQLHPL